MIDKSIKDLSDEEIVQAIVEQGKVSLMEVLYDRYERKVFYKCLGITRDSEISKDYAHDIFIKIFTKLQQFKGTSNFSLWVHSITYNYCMDQIKKKKKLTFSELSNSHEPRDIGDIENENRELMELRHESLDACMAELSQSERMILVMRYQDNLSVTQIAETLKVGESAVKMRLKRSRDKLAQRLQEITSIS